MSAVNEHTNHIHSNSIFPTYIQGTQQTCTNTNSILQILHILSKSKKLHTAEQLEVNKSYTAQPQHVLNDHKQFQVNTLFEFLKKHYIHSQNNTPTNELRIRIGFRMLRIRCYSISYQRCLRLENFRSNMPNEGLLLTLIKQSIWQQGKTQRCYS